MMKKMCLKDLGYQGSNPVWISVLLNLAWTGVAKTDVH